MAKSKHIDKICICAIVVALVMTILFMNGKNLGVQTIVAEENETSEFTDNDLTGNWSTSSATVITLTGDSGSVKGNGAYIYEGDVYIVYAGKYVITGELDDGSVIIDADGDDKIWIQLNNANLTSSDGPALLVENADKVFLTTAEGTENTITGGETYSDEAVENGYDGALYSRDDLTINGSGSLTVTGNYEHGIVCNDDLVITGGTINVEAAEDAIHANDSVRIANAEITLDAGDDGITVSNDDGSDYFYMESGSLTIDSCYEGLEAANVTITGGTVTVYPTDDGINVTSSEGSVEISGGLVTIINTEGRDADGIDSNGSIHVTGGRVFVSVPSDGVSTALDYGSENHGELLIDGGTVIAAGSSGMLEEISENSAQGFVVYTGDEAEAETTFTLSDSEGTDLLSDVIPIGFSALIVSTEEMVNGESYTITINEEETTLTAGENVGGGFGSMGGFGNFGGKHSGKSDAGESGNAEMIMDGEMPDAGEMPTPGEMPTDGEMPDFDEMFADGEMPDFENTEVSATANSENSDQEKSDSDTDEAEKIVMTTESETETESGSTQSQSVHSKNPDENGEAESEQENTGDASDTTTEDTEQSHKSDKTMGGHGQGGGNRGGSNSDGQMMPGMENQQTEDTGTITVTTETWVLLGCSILVMLIGLILAFRAKGR